MFLTVLVPAHPSVPDEGPLNGCCCITALGISLNLTIYSSMSMSYLAAFWQTLGNQIPCGCILMTLQRKCLQSYIMPIINKQVEMFVPIMFGSIPIN